MGLPLSFLQTPVTVAVLSFNSSSLFSWDGPNSVLLSSEINLVHDYLSRPTLLLSVGISLLALGVLAAFNTYRNDAIYLATKRASLVRQMFAEDQHRGSAFGTLRPARSSHSHSGNGGGSLSIGGTAGGPAPRGRRLSDSAFQRSRSPSESSSVVQCNRCMKSGFSLCVCVCTKTMTIGQSGSGESSSGSGHTLSRSYLWLEPLRNPRLMSCVVYVICCVSIIFGSIHVVRTDSFSYRSIHLIEGAGLGSSKLLSTLRWTAVAERVGMLWFVAAVSGFALLQAQVAYPFKLKPIQANLRSLWLSISLGLTFIQLALDCAFQLANPTTSAPREWVMASSAVYASLFFIYILALAKMFPNLRKTIQDGDNWKRDQAQRLCIVSMFLAALNVYLTLVVIAFLVDVFGWFYWIISAHWVGTLFVNGMMQWLYWGRKSADQARRALSSQSHSALAAESAARRGLAQIPPIHISCQQHQQQPISTENNSNSKVFFENDSIQSQRAAELQVIILDLDRRERERERGIRDLDNIQEAKDILPPTLKNNQQQIKLQEEKEKEEEELHFIYTAYNK